MKLKEYTEILDPEIELIDTAHDEHLLCHISDVMNSETLRELNITNGDMPKGKSVQPIQVDTKELDRDTYNKILKELTE